VTRCSDVAMSAGGEAAPRRGKGGDDVSWADANLYGLNLSNYVGILILYWKLKGKYY
jgi:hypothetical protein